MRPSVVRVETSRSTGSGIIVETDGNSATVLTNHHVVDGGWSPTVRLYSGEGLTATVVGYNSYHDLAVLRVCCSNFRAASVAADPASPGETVFTMGYPLGVGSATVTRGIVSATWWDEDSDRWLVQTDAPINPGNSGGPLFNMDGAVTGINTFIVREVHGRDIEGFGFAVAARTISASMPNLMAGLRLSSEPLVFPTYQAVAASLDLDQSLNWVYNPSGSFYYGVGPDKLDGAHYIIPTRPLNQRVFFNLPINDTRVELHIPAISDMLVAIGYDPTQAKAVAARHAQLGRPGECMTRRQVLIASWWQSETSRWVSGIYANTDPYWREAEQC